MLAFIAYGGFHLWEYATGGKYVKFLKANAETVPLEEHFTYANMADDIARSKLILVGEIHGFKEPCRFDVDFFKHLHEHHDVNHYFAELDFVQAQYLNRYLRTGDEELLKDVLRNWAVVQGRNNQSYFDKYVRLQEYYQQLSEDDRFEFIGIDQIQDLGLTMRYLHALMPEQERDTEAVSIDSMLNAAEALRTVYADSSDILLTLNHISKNLASLKTKEYRENVLFNNFHGLYTRYALEDSRCYGFFGLYHVFQYRVSGEDPLASKIRQSDLGLENGILSMNFMLNDSYMVMPSAQLPEFMRNEGKYTRMPISADNMLFMYIFGIKDFKRMTPEHHKSLIRMVADDNPYVNTGRLNTTIQLLPVTELFEMNDKGKPYVQYTVFVRNSDWAEPIE